MVPLIDQQQIVAQFKGGLTTGQIAQRFRVSRQRVHQVLSKHGISGTEGGQAKRVRERRKRQARARNRRFHLLYGINETTYLSFVKHHGRGPLDAYIKQRANARSVGITWRLTFEDWWQIWESSRQWHERGRGRFSLVRVNTDRGFEPGNVRIESAASRMKRVHQKRARK